jgi:hypothetical protein
MDAPFGLLQKTVARADRQKSDAMMMPIVRANGGRRKTLYEIPNQSQHTPTLL